jgi:hypothetical protein
VLSPLIFTLEEGISNVYKFQWIKLNHSKTSRIIGYKMFTNFQIQTKYSLILCTDEALHIIEEEVILFLPGKIDEKAKEIKQKRKNKKLNVFLNCFELGKRISERSFICVVKLEIQKMTD